MDVDMDHSNLRPVQERLGKEVIDACKDGVFDADDLASINNLRDRLKVDDKAFRKIKTDALDALLTRTLKNGEVSEGQVALVKQLHDGLDLDKDESLEKRYRQTLDLKRTK